MRKRFPVLAAALLALFPAAASPQEAWELLPWAYTPEQEAEQLAEKLAPFGIEVSWEEAFRNNLGVHVRNLVVRGSRATLTAATASVSGGAARELEDVVIKGLGENVTGVTMEASRMHLRNSEALLPLVSWKTCGPDVFAGRESRLVAWDVVLRGMAMDRDIPITTDRLDSSFVTAVVRSDHESGCLTLDRLEVRNLVAQAPDRSRMHVERIEFTHSGLERRNFNLDMRVLNFFDSEGLSLALVQRVSGGLRENLPTRLTTDEASLIDALSRGSLNARFEMSRLVLPVRGIIVPEGERVRGPDRFFTILRVSGDVSDGRMKLSGSISTDMLGDLAMQADLRFTEGGSIGALAGVLGDQPGLVLADRIAIEGAEISFVDRGFIDLLKRFGITLDSTRDILARHLANLPEEMRNILDEAIERAWGGSARLVMAPEVPTTLTQAAVAGLLGPAQVLRMLGVAVE